MGYVFYNPNPKRKKVCDCVVRAICKATDKEWIEVFAGLCEISLKVYAMPSEKPVYERYLKSLGFEWVGYKAKAGSHRPTVASISRDLDWGSIPYVLSVAGHLVTCKDGNYYDLYDSGDSAVYGYYRPKEEA